VYDRSVANGHETEAHYWIALQHQLYLASYTQSGLPAFIR